MACDDESGGGTSRILWYEVGRSEGAASMRRNQEIQEARHWNAGVRTINLKDYQVLVANRDQLWREAHHYHHELQLANQEIAKANSHIRQLSREIETQESTNLAYPVCCQYDESVIICRSGLPRLSNNASRFSAGFSR